MAKKSNSTMKIVSIILLIAGTGLVLWGYQISGSFGSQLNNAFNGAPSDRVIIFYIGGAISLIVGIYLQLRR